VVLTLTVIVEGEVAELRVAVSQFPPEVVLGVAVRLSPLGALLMVQVPAPGALPPMVKAKLSEGGVHTAVMAGCALTVNATARFNVAVPGALTAIEPL